MLALEVGGVCRDVVKSKQRRLAIPKMCALADPRQFYANTKLGLVAFQPYQMVFVKTSRTFSMLYTA